jgi:hypothetical protein
VNGRLEEVLSVGSNKRQTDAFVTSESRLLSVTLLAFHDLTSRGTSYAFERSRQEGTIDSRHSNVSLPGSATGKATYTDRNATVHSASYEQFVGGRALASDAALEHEAIAAIAHHYWQERGCPEGSAAEDWFRAEQDFHNRIEFGYFPDYFEVGVPLQLPH